MNPVTARFKLFCIYLICVLALGFIFFEMTIAFIFNTNRLWSIYTAIDRAGNASLGGNDSETLSSRAYRVSTDGRHWACVLCKVLDRLAKDHCKNSLGK